MIEFLSSWAKGLGLAIVIVSILEMLLPNNKTKKYIRMVMGLYILFTIISPFIKNRTLFNVENIDLSKELNNYSSVETSVDQASMDERIQVLYVEELEKDITKKVEEKGYEVTECKVKANIQTLIDSKEAQIADIQDENNTISKIKLKIEKNEENKKEENETIENKMVNEIQKIKPVNTQIQNNNKEEKEEKITRNDIQNIKKFLMEEYEVEEKCLEIN